ncbi:MAG: hypothetical protein P8N07_09085 [Flavobacteriales bacterium]|nr:hypothetical protein [Flavobacteriales bacterium]
MKTNKRIITAIALLTLFLVGVSCTSSKSVRKCDGKKGQKTRMGTI